MGHFKNMFLKLTFIFSILIYSTDHAISESMNSSTGEVTFNSSCTEAQLLSTCNDVLSVLSSTNVTVDDCFANNYDLESQLVCLHKIGKGTLENWNKCCDIPLVRSNSNNMDDGAGDHDSDVNPSVDSQSIIFTVNGKSILLKDKGIIYLGGNGITHNVNLQLKSPFRGIFKIGETASVEIEKGALGMIVEDIADLYDNEMTTFCTTGQEESGVSSAPYSLTYAIESNIETADLKYFVNNNGALSGSASSNNTILVNTQYEFIDYLGISNTTNGFLNFKDDLSDGISIDGTKGSVVRVTLGDTLFSGCEKVSIVKVMGANNDSSINSATEFRNHASTWLSNNKSKEIALENCTNDCETKKNDYLASLGSNARTRVQITDNKFDNTTRIKKSYFTANSNYRTNKSCGKKVLSTKPFKVRKGHNNRKGMSNLAFLHSLLTRGLGIRNGELAFSILNSVFAEESLSISNEEYESTQNGQRRKTTDSNGCENQVTAEKANSSVKENTSGSNTSGSGGPDFSNAITDRLELVASDDKKLFKSSYNTYLLPAPGVISDGYSVSFKAVNGPLYIHPGFNAAQGGTYEDRPKVGGTNNYIVLTVANAYVTLTYSSSSKNWAVTASSSSSHYSYDVRKDDAPTSCPTGYIPVRGNYLYETKGFCVQPNATFGFVSNRHNSYNYALAADAKCTAEELGINTGDKSGVLSKNQLLSIYSDALLELEGNDGLSNSEATLFNTLRGIPFNKNSTPSGLSLSSTSQKYFLARWINSYKSGGKSYYKYRAGGLEVIDPVMSDDGFTFLTNSYCTDLNTKTINTGNKVSLNYTANSATNLPFDINTDQYSNQKTNSCNITSFDYFMGGNLHSNLNVSSIYSNYLTTATASTSKYVMMVGTGKTLVANSPSARAWDSVRGSYRCAITPNYYTCYAASSNPGYDTSNCDSSNGQISAASCQLSCATGYTSLTGGSPSATCTGLGNNFVLSGCYSTSMLAGNETISSCKEVTTSGVYKMNLTGANGTVTSDVKVFCAVDLETSEKYIDVVKTFAIPNIDVNTYSGYFFETNNSSPITVTTTSNNSGKQGILVVNTATKESTTNYTEGFYINQDTLRFDNVDLNYSMQGSSEVANYCNTSNIVPLSGPGSTVGNTSYQASANCPSGKTCIEGNTSNSDAPINASYVSSSLTGNDLLTFGSAGRPNVDILSSCSRDSNIPSTLPATFITKMLVKNSAWKTCSIPSSSTGYDINCNTSGSYFDENQCTVSCATNYSTNQYIPVSISCSADKSEFKLAGCFSGSPTNAQVAAGIIASNNVLHMDASHGVTIDDNGKVVTWASRPNKNGTSYAMNRHSNSGPTVNSSGPTTFLNFTNNYNEKLLNNDFQGTNGVSELTRIFVYKPTKQSYNMLYYSLAAGWDGYYHTPNKFHIKTNFDNNYASHYESDKYLNQLQVQITTFDSKQLTNADRLKVSFNGTNIPLANYSASAYLGPKDNAPGFVIGGWTSNSYAFKGDLYEAIIFDKKLPAAQIELLTTHLQKKHGIIKVCELPSNTDRYDVSSCDTSSEMLTESECSITCGTGTSTHALVPIKATCSVTSGTFSLQGCFASAPTTAELAEGILTSKNVAYWHAGNGVTTIGGKVDSWESVPNKFGETVTVTANNNTSIGYTTSDESFGSQPSLNFHGGAWLTNTSSFTRMQNKANFTRFVFARRSESAGTRRAPPLSDNSTGYESWQDTSNFYYRANTSAYSYVSSSGILSSEPFISLSTFDASKTTSAQRLVTRYNSTPITFSYYSGTPSATSNGSSIYIGANYSSQSSYNWIGDILAVGYFDETLTSGEITILETYFKKKYGITKVCNLPASTTGYDTNSCDTSNEILSESECSVSCASGYSTLPLTPATAKCSVGNGSFSLNGCYPTNNIPASSLTAEQFILDNNVAFWHAGNGVKTSGGKVQSWDSVPNKFGETITVTSNNSTIGYTDSDVSFGSQPSLNFPGGAWLTDTSNFTSMQNKANFTRFVVARRSASAGTRRAPPLSDNSTGYESWQDTYLYSTVSPSAYFKVASSGIISSEPFISLSTFDSSKSTNAERLVTRYNSNPITYTYSGGTFSTTSSGSNIYIGGYYSSTSSYNWMGDILAVGYFDQTLTTEQINQLENYFMKKYGIINVCSLPDNTSNYNTSSCDTSNEMLSESECSVTCASGTSTHPLVSVKAICSNANGSFSLQGCFSSTPTTAQLANGILSEAKVHFNAASGFSTNGNSASWNSVVGNSTVTGNSSGVSYVASNSSFEGNPTIHMTGSGSYLNDSSFNGMTGAVNFAKIAVFSSDTSASVNKVLASDGVTGSLQNYYHNFYSYVNNGGGRVQASKQFATGIPYVHLHSFDSTKGTNDTKNTVRLDGSELPVTYYSTQATSGSGAGVQISHSGAPWHGDLAEYALFDRALTDNEIQLLEHHLRVKYGQIKQCFANATTGYNITGCNTGGGAISSAECNISCDTNSSYIGTASKSCINSNTDFSFGGCFDPGNITSTPSCGNVSSSGVYITNLTSADGSITKDLRVYCTIHSETNDGYLDIVKTFQIPGIDIDVYKDYFFTSNDSSSISVAAKTNDQGIPGILLVNTGDNGAAQNHKEGFHITQNVMRYDDVRLSYHMQGGRSSNNCSRSNWVPLNGPGYNGGNSSYLSSCSVNKTCIQGTSTYGRDAAINVEDYTNANFKANELLSFSGTGGLAETVYSCSESISIPKVYGVPKSSTFITNLLVRDSTFKICDLPPDVTGYDVSNCDTSQRNIASNQCSLTCAVNYSGTAAASCSINGGDFALSGCYTTGDIPQVLLQDNFNSYDSNFLTDDNFTSKWSTFRTKVGNSNGNGTGGLTWENGKIWPYYVSGSHWGASIYTKNEIDVGAGVTITFNLEHVSSYGNGTATDGIYIYPMGTNMNSVTRNQYYGHGSGNYGSAGEAYTHPFLALYRSISRTHAFVNNLTGNYSVTNIPQNTTNLSVTNYAFKLEIYDGKYKGKIYGDVEGHQPYYVSGNLPAGDDFSKMTVDFFAGDYKTGVSKFDNIKIQKMATCNVPSIPHGYIVTGCNEGSSSISAKCNISCSSGYTSNDLIGGPDATCPAFGANMIFTGCE
ncbi:MAG: hypothetical protein HOJ35_10605 [Bdellovibrionales bacterium]|nr:hypothetical protein [Bdellovibrionales bacterium]